MQHNLDLLKLGGRRYKLQSGRIDIIIRRKIESTEERRARGQSLFVPRPQVDSSMHGPADTL